MLGTYDFCAHYDWTFQWLLKRGGDPLVQSYWDKAIHGDSQQHAAKLIREKGFEGMREYWGHTLTEEAADFRVTSSEDCFRIDMHRCPSKGFLIDNQVQFFHDYPNHCMGWIGPMMHKAGFAIHHEHNHSGQCWWEFRSEDDNSTPSKPGSLAGDNDVRLSQTWLDDPTPVDRFLMRAGKSSSSRFSK